MQIGDLSERTGVSPQLLRTWERRYGLLSPGRTSGGFRVYSPKDEQRVRAMNERLEDGFAAAAAARLVLEAKAETPHARAEGQDQSDGAEGVCAELLDELHRASGSYDEVASNAVLDRALERFTLETVLRSLVVPFLRDLGLRWEAGEVTIAQEHFATGLIQARLLALARSWGTGAGPRALLACPPGELHDLALVCFGLALRERGWRITLLGANTPIPTLRDAAEALSPDLVVIATMQPERILDHRGEVSALARRFTVGLAGPGATEEAGRATDTLLLLDAPTRAAARVAQDFASRHASDRDAPG